MTAPNTPTYLVPSSPGQLSNKRGSNTAGDAISLQCKYSNPRSTADKAGTIRVIFQRTVQAGGSLESPPEVAWDSGWDGTPTTTPLPTVPVGTAALASLFYNGRLYVSAMSSQITSLGVPITASLYSAPVTGGSVGTWRAENSIAWAVPAGSLGGGISSICVAAGRMYACDLSSNIAYATINSDGTLGSWTTSTSKPAQPGTLIGGQVGPTAAVPNQGWLAIIGGQGQPGTVNASTSVQNVGLNADGSLQGWVSGTALPAARSALAVFYNSQQGYVFVVGGADGAGTAQSTVWHAPVTGLGAVGTWVLTDNAIPAGRSGLGIAFDYVTSTVWVVGGATGGVSQATVYNHALSATGGAAGAWTTLGTNIPAAVLCPACYYSYAGNTAMSGNPTFLISAGGQITTVYDWNGISWISGVAGGLTSGNLGTGGVLVNNPDGTQDMTFLYQAFQTTPPSPFNNGFNDGDQIQVTVQFTDVNNGDPSGIATTLIKIGQPPSISNVSPSGAGSNCQPTVSFNYSTGAGGGPENKYQIQVKNNGGVVVADTGLIVGQANSYSPKIYPMLASGLAASTVITVFSLDTPMPGSTNSAQVTTAFTPTQAPPSTPTSLSIGIDAVNGDFGVNWTNPVGGVTPTFNRVYWRLSGASIWNPGKDLFVPAAQGSSNQALFWEPIPLNTAVEFGVSSLAGTSPGTTESAIVSAGTGTLTPDYHWDTGGWVAMLNIVGGGLSYRVPLTFIPPVKFSRHIDSEVVQMFGNTAPSIRYGTFNYREIELDVRELTSQIPTLDTLLNQAQLGNVIVYRDTMGNVIYCGLPPDKTREIDLYYQDTLTLVEQQFTYTPSAF